MKVAVASSGLGHVARGIEAWAADLARALAERCVDVILYKGGGQPEASYERVVPCWQRSQPRTERLLGRLPRRLSWRLGLGSGYAVEQTTFAWGLLRHLRRERPDILHVQDPLVALFVQRARRLRWVPTRVVLAHGTEEPPSFLRKINFLQHLASWHLEEARSAGAWKPTWAAIPNFIDTTRFRPGRADSLRAELGIPAKGLVVLTVAAVKRAHKRVDYLIDEFVRLLLYQPGLPIWLVVAGGREGDTDALVEEGRRRLGDRVRFLVGFPRSRMPELYRAADVFVLCSLKEMMPVALLEATASGLPCVVHRHPVMEWMVGPGGRPVDLAGPGALAGALGELLNEPTARARLGVEGRGHCEATFRREAVVERVLEYYRLVLAGAPALTLAATEHFRQGIQGATGVA